MAKKRSESGKILQFLRLESRQSVERTLLSILLGTVFYIILYIVILPEYKVMGMLTVQINLALLVIPVVAAFSGPFSGFSVGLVGTLGTDALFTQQIIAFGTIDLSYALLGFIAGIPHYAQGGGFSKGRTLGKLILFTGAGFLVMLVVYLFGLVVIAGQNILPTVLYNLLPFFSVSLIALLIVAPVAVRLVQVATDYAKQKLL